MDVQVMVELPQTVFSALRSSPDEFMQEMRLAAAVNLPWLAGMRPRTTRW